MIAEILSTGDEIRSGAIADTNSAYIARRLEEAGLHVVRHQCVGDDMERLISVLQEISGHADVAVVTGGLGPTPDDLTTEAAAKTAGVELVLNPTALTAIERLFKTRNRFMSPSNRKQAMFPMGAAYLPNPIGTAPGFLLRVSRCAFFFLPGVPSEMRRMMSDAVLPQVAALQGGVKKFMLARTLSCFGITEAETGDRLVDLSAAFPKIKVGLRADFPVIQVKLYGRGDDEEQLRRELGKAAEWAREKIGLSIFSTEGNSMEAEVGHLLKRSRATLAVAESCTGGLIADRLTNVPGSSDYFLFSAVTYSNDAKVKVLGVAQDTLSRLGAVDEETAKEMAAGARRVAGATYGLSTSGIAGPDGGTPDKPVGTVCVGLAGPDGVSGVRYHFSYPERLRNKTLFAVSALNLLRKKLIGE